MIFSLIYQVCRKLLCLERSLVLKGKKIELSTKLSDVFFNKKKNNICQQLLLDKFQCRLLLKKLLLMLDEFNFFFQTQTLYLLQQVPIFNIKVPFSSYPLQFTDHDRVWTGFYTSRPNLKLFSRRANSLLQIIKQFYVLHG